MKLRLRRTTTNTTNTTKKPVETHQFGGARYYERIIFQHVWRDVSHRVFDSNSRHSFIHVTLNEVHIANLSTILLESLLAHRFNSASWALYGLCARRNHVPELIWRAGLEVIKHLPKSQNNIIQHYKRMYHLIVPYHEEFLLDFTFYLISTQEDIVEGYELLKTRLSKAKFSKSIWLRAHLGVLEFVQWQKSLLSKPVEVHEDDIDDDGEAAELIKKSKSKTGHHATKAIWCFQGIVDRDGIWDVFIIKHVELLIYYRRYTDAQELLETFRDRNMENPNSHRYLYYFLKHIGADASTLRDVLGQLVSVDPTTEHLMEYLNLNKQCDNKKTLSVEIEALFDKLDHSACSTDPQLWKKLQSTLKTVSQLSDKHAQKTLNECWDTREDWWPQYHFNLRFLSDMEKLSDNEMEVLKCKAQVAGYLLGNGNQFTQMFDQHCSEQNGIPQKVEETQLNNNEKQNRKKTFHLSKTGRKRAKYDGSVEVLNTHKKPAKRKKN